MPAQLTEPKLRVLLVEFNPSGGLFQFALQMGEALADRGHDVQLVTGRDPELPSRAVGLRLRAELPTWHPMDDGDVAPIVRRARRAGRLLRYAWAYVVLRRIVRRERPDVVQWSNWRFPIDGPLVRWVGTATRAAMIDLAHSPRPLNEQHSTGEVHKRLGRFRGAQELAYRRMDDVLVLGEASRVDLLTTWPGVQRVQVVPHGDEGVFRQGDPGLPSGCGPTVLFFGNLAGYKGLDVLLPAFALVRQQLPSAQLIVAGATVGDVDVPALRAQARAIGGVDLQVGYVPVQAVAPLFTRARVVVAPYRYANGSGVVSLAQTFGRPVVASDVGDLPAAVQHELTGLLVPVEDPHRLAAALLRVLQDDVLADRLGSAGESAIQERGSWRVVAGRLEEVYMEALKRRDSRARVQAAPHA